MVFNFMPFQKGHKINIGQTWSIGKKASLETRNKMRDAHLGEKNHFYGKTHTTEVRLKLSKIGKRLVGPKNPFYGKKHTEETKKRLREINLGKKLSQEVKEKIGRKSLGRGQSMETRRKRSLSMVGIVRSEQTRQKIRLAKTGLTGEEAGNWRGGITPLYLQIRHSSQYKKWRDLCFRRDNYTCQKCGLLGGNLSVDHIKSFAIIVLENRIMTLEDAVNCEELWDVNNGRTLCWRPCHLEINKKEKIHEKATK